MVFSENDIRPKNLDEGKIAAMQKDSVWLRSRKDIFVEVPCPAYVGKDNTLAFTKCPFSFARCTSCGTLFMTPRAPESLLNELSAPSALTVGLSSHLYVTAKKIP